MNKIMDYKKMENEIDKYFVNLTDEQFIADLESADYSFYQGITAEFLGVLDTTHITYGQIKISSSKVPFTLPTRPVCSYKNMDFFIITDDYKLAA